MLGRERHESESIMMRSMPMRRTRAAIANPAKVVHCLPHRPTLGQCGKIFAQPLGLDRNVVRGPMMPGASRCIRVVAEQSQASTIVRDIGPDQRRGTILAFTSIELGNPLAFPKGGTRQLHRSRPFLQSYPRLGIVPFRLPLHLI